MNEQSIKQLALKGGNLVSKLYTRQHHAPALLASACEAQLDSEKGKNGNFLKSER